MARRSVAGTTNEATDSQEVSDIGKGRVEFLFVVDNLRPGGAQKILFSIVTSLNRSRIRPVVWCLGEGGTLESALRRQGIPVIRFGRFQMFSGLAIPWMAGHIRRNRVALIQSFLFHSDNLARTLGRLMRVPVVVASARAPDTRKPVWKRWIDRRTAAWADLTIAVSPAALAHAVQHEGVPRHRSAVVLNGIDARAYDPTLRLAAHDVADEAIPPDARVVGTVGRLGPEKAHRSLLEAFAKVRKRVPGAHLLVVGDGPLKADLMGLAQKLGMAPAVHFLGFREDVPRLLGAMEVFCLPSLFEGIANALLEAMAMAKACVATSVAGNRILIEDGVHGLLVPPGDDQALANALTTLLQNPELARRLGAAARRRVVEEFSLARMLQGYAEAYATALSRKRKSTWIAATAPFEPEDLLRLDARETRNPGLRGSASGESDATGGL